MNKNTSNTDKREIAKETAHMPDRDQTFHRSSPVRPDWSGDVEDSIKGEREDNRDLVDDIERLSGPPRTLDDRSPEESRAPLAQAHGNKIPGLAAIRKDLEQRRRDLSEGIKASQSEAQAIITGNTDGHPVDYNHPADMVEGDGDYDKFLQLSRMQKAELLLVDHALERIASNQFGDCEKCGDHLSIGRLKAVPYARFCVSCQQQVADVANTW